MPIRLLAGRPTGISIGASSDCESDSDDAPGVLTCRSRSVYYAEACEPIVAASKEGTIQIQALGRGYYHGKPIPDDEIAAVKHLGYWDANQDQNWGLPWHRNEGIELAAFPDTPWVSLPRC